MAEWIGIDQKGIARVWGDTYLLCEREAAQYEKKRPDIKLTVKRVGLADVLRDIATPAFGPGSFFKRQAD